MIVDDSMNCSHKNLLIIGMLVLLVPILSPVACGYFFCCWTSFALRRNKQQYI